MTAINVPVTHRIHRVGGWLPIDHRVQEAWLDDIIARATRRPKGIVHPVISEFQELIEGDSTFYMLFHEMFEQVPFKSPYCHDPTGEPQIRDYKTMLSVLDFILGTAPEWNEKAAEVGLVGFPINAVLDWPMGTPAGFAAFADPRINAMFKRLFDVWAGFLTSPSSTYVLSTEPDGWFGPLAAKAMPDFDNTFVCDPSAPYHGFTSWDDFFTRVFREGVRLVSCPDDDRIVVSACEAAPLRVAVDVAERDSFWLKGQPYSVLDMLAQDPFAEQFVGGTVYQAFLSATSYHRWHAPVSGRVSKVVPIAGTYYNEPFVNGFPTPDPGAPNLSQAYLTQVATRVLVFIEADNTDIGLMCFMAVGMAEVSTCEVTVQPGQHIRKGDEIGMFHFGGSTHCLIFRKGVELVFDLHGQTPGEDAKNINVSDYLALVKPAQ